MPLSPIYVSRQIARYQAENYRDVDWRCPECKEKTFHKSTCSHCQDVSVEQWKNHADNLANDLAVRQKLSKEYLNKAHQWEGKFAILRHENNKLRKLNEVLRRRIQDLQSKP